MASLECNISVESIIMKSLSDFICKVKDEHGVVIESVSPYWIESMTDDHFVNVGVSMRLSKKRAGAL